MFTAAAPTVSRRRAARAVQACEECRQRKRRCDGDFPCVLCKEGMLQCRYASVQPSKVDKMFGELTRSLARLSQHQEALIAKVGMLEARLDRSGVTNLPWQHVNQRVPPNQEDFKPLRLVQTSIRHTTPPHELIRLWPSLLPLLQAAMVGVDSTYVSKLERCESLQLCDTENPPALHDVMNVDTVNSTRSTREVLLAEGVLREHNWCVQPCLRASVVKSLCERYERHIHILHPFLDAQELRGFRDRFIGWEDARLSECDHPLKRRYTDGFTGHPSTGAKAIQSAVVPVGHGLDHALVYAALALGAISAHDGPVSTPVNDPHTDEAVDPRCAQVGRDQCRRDSQMTRPTRESTPAGPYPTPDAMRSFPNAGYFAGSTLSGTYHSTDRALGERHRRPTDVTPGFHYYGKARYIIDECTGGDELLLAQVYLLTGLYNGQLACVRESMRCYARAGKLLLSLLDRYNLCDDNMNPQDDVEGRYRRAQSRIKDKRHNLIVLASWTCLQLESDILADLHLPSSGIQEVQHLLPLPLDLSGSRVLEPGERASESYHTRHDIFIHFAAQSFLRKRLNLVHGQLYGLDCLDRSPAEMQQTIDSHRTILDHWKQQLPEALKWDDSDLPSPDILSARLRAKYWGAQYIVTRPFLDYVLHVMPHIYGGRSVEEVALDASGKRRSTTEIQIFKAIHLIKAEEIWRACQKCLEAAARSTTAFDGIPDRLIITNIHGTAHAQFGNMLVLAAAWRDGRLRELVDRACHFQALLDRTIVFLDDLAAMSPTCRVDREILVKLRSLLFGDVSSDGTTACSDDGSGTSTW